MMKKWICLLLVAVMLLPATAFVQADGETDGEVPKDGEGTVITTLTATGGTYPYDGKAHAVTYTLENGEAYKNVYFSVDGGETWTKTAPSLTNVGKITVTVRAVKEGGKDPLTVQVNLEVTAAAVDGSSLTIVNCNTSANVREKATSNSKKLGEAKKGKTFKLLGKEGNWYKIQYTADTVGYVFHTYGKVGNGSAASPTPTASVKPTGNVGTIVNVKSAVNVRAKASSSSKKLGTAKNGDVFTVLGTSGRWVKVSYEGGVAYIYDYYVKLSNSETDPTSKPTSKPTPTPKVNPVAGEKGYIVNCNTQVNVWEKAASTNSKILGVLKKGAEVTVTGTSGKWTEIAYKGGTAYVFTEYVSATKPGSEVVGKTATVVNCSSFVNVRSKANSSSKKLGEAKKGETYTVQAVSGNWVKVDYDGVSGFIYKRYIKIG